MTAPQQPDAPCPAWVSQPARQVAGAVLTGAVIGAGVTGVWISTLRAAQSCFTTIDGSPGVACVLPDVGGTMAGALLGILGSLAGFALLRIRPLLVTVPLAMAVTWLGTRAVTGPVTGGNAPVLWAAATLVAAGFGAVALTAATRGWLRAAGCVLLAALLIASWMLPR